VAKKRVGRYSNEFRRMCVERMKQCDDIGALARELNIHRRYLYRWRDQLEPAEKSEGPPPQNSRESTLRKEVSQLKRVLAEKTLELDFFKGALQKVEARQQQSGGSGAKASTTKSGK
jgi:transposase